MTSVNLTVPIKVNLPDDWIEQIVNRLRNDPDSEWVEVIRCKGCKHCDKGIDEDGKPFLKCLGWVYGGTSETDFCSHAERREK